ncbi:DNA polymerase I [Vallitalea okinawensis]|uniref:DNA polymerase I n=1 Tax=Vallitalea okinawensis TaxID=2078660 RepID=UPI000CFBB280|nr:DNA polymerase I [Vallitalea okinawensis]
MKNENKLLIVDGHSILNRAFYGIPLLTNKDGQPTNAVYGFMNILLKVIHDEQPTHIGVAFDVKAPTFRHKMFTEYKGTRKGMPDELRQQVPVIKELLSKMSIPIFEKDGYEADDVLGTLANQYEKQNFQVTVLSGDRDLLQLATEAIKIKIPKTKGNKTEVEEYFAKDVEEKYGVTPTEFIDVKALMGDTSDNIPGVPSIGEKTAVKIIQAYNNIENAIDHAEEIKPKRASENLRTYEDQARMSKELATICIDCPIDMDIAFLDKKNLVQPEAIDYMQWLEFKLLIERLLEDAGETQSTTLEIHYNIVDSLANLKDQLKGIEELAFKILPEFKYVSLSVKDQTYIIDLENHDMHRVTEVLKDVLEDNDIKKIGYHAKDDIHVLHEAGIQLEGLQFDAMIAAYLINPSKDDYSINTLAYDYLHTSLPSEEQLLGKGRKRIDIRELEEEQRLSFVASHSLVPYMIKDNMLKLIDDAGMMPLYLDIELPLISVLADMEERGISVNQDGLRVYGEQLEITLNQIEKDIYDLAGEKFNINSPKQLGVILFEKLELTVIKKTKTGYSTAADVLDKLKYEHAIVELILEYRQLSKLKSTYVDGLFAVIDQDTSKIYSTFKQTVAATGRISSTEPNLQNIPIRMEMGRQLRKVFIPTSEEYVFVDADYSQIELRLLAHLSEDDILIKAYQEDEDIHRLTASQVFNTPLEEVSSLQRSNAKAVNFGIIYGISAFSLSGDLKITRKEAQQYITAYFDKYPKVKAYLDQCVESAKETGYATTMFNRRRKIDELRSRNFIQRGFGERVAKNMPIQGSAADVIKIAMVNVHKRLKDEELRSKLILQVHDELLIETHKDEIEIVKTILEEEMTHAADVKVPLDIDMHTGDNWYETK